MSIKPGEARLIKAALIYLGVIVVAVAMILPFYWAVLVSFKQESGISTTRLVLFDFRHLTLENYLYALKYFGIGLYFKNSAIITAIGMLFQVAVSALAAYPLGRMGFPGKNVLIASFLATMMITDEMTAIPLYLVVTNVPFLHINLGNTYAGVILPAIPWGFLVFMLTRFFAEIPKEMEEAAVIDGCSVLGVFGRIILPLSKPVLGSVLVFSFLNFWDQFLIPLIVVNTRDLMPLTLGLRIMLSAEQTFYGNFMSATVIATLPAVIVFLYAQRYFIAGIATGALKG